MAKRVATTQKLEQADAELTSRSEPRTYEKLRELTGGGSYDTIQNWIKEKNETPPAPEAVQMLARIAAQQIWAAANDEAVSKIASNNLETKKCIEAMKQEISAVSQVKDQLAELNAALKIGLETAQKENAQLHVKLLEVNALQREIAIVRADVERRRTDAENLRINLADSAGQIKILREQLKVRKRPVNPP